MPAPQIRLTAPAPDDVRAWLIAQPDTPPTYPAAGATRDAPTDGRPPPGVPAGWNVDHRRVHLGDGEAVYAAAQAALMTFAPLDIGWVWPVTTTPRAEPSTRGAMIVRAFGMVWVNAWRIVYVDDDVATADGRRRTAFAYGTMEAHAERGEERFMVEVLPDGSVWYDVLAFSHPHHILARLGGPVTRWLQRRFGPASVGRMREVVAIVVGEEGEVESNRAGASDTAAVLRNPRMAAWVAPAYVPRAVLGRAAAFGVVLLFLLAYRAFGDTFGEPPLLAFLDGIALIGAVMSMTLVVALAMPLTMLVPAKRQTTAEMVSAVVLPNTLFLLGGLQFDNMRWGIGLTRWFYAYCAAYFAYMAIRHGRSVSTLPQPAVRPAIVARAALVLWTVGAIWFVLDGFQLTPLGFPQAIVRLTAVHFHFAGFILPVIAATLARAYPSRLANAAAVVALLGVPSTAIGITATQLGAPHVVEALLALPMIAGALLVAAVHLGLAFGPRNLEAPMRVVALRAVVGFTLLATMALALAYALRGWLPWAPTIPQMALWHGIGNAFGVATCGLVACWLDPATQPPVG